MGSITYAVGDMDNHFLSGEKAKNKKDANKIERRFGNRVKTDYVSLLAGPTLRANEWVSAFGLLGVALHSVENSMYETNKTSVPPKQVSRNKKPATPRWLTHWDYSLMSTRGWLLMRPGPARVAATGNPAALISVSAINSKNSPMPIRPAGVYWHK
ncbi:hypothetical protein SODG_004771 [Sodalis praecaptivus]